MENNTIPTAVRRLLIIAVALLVIALLASGANVYMTLAAPRQSVFVPTTVGFEGRLADSSGQPLADGNYDITFSLYSQAEGGTTLWTETQTVTSHSGLYSVQLGATTPLQPNSFDGARWFGVKVGSEAELIPRIQIGAVPFALNANQAMGLQGRNVSAAAPQNGQVLTWNADSAQWLPGAVPPPQYPQRAFGFHANDTVVTGGAMTRVQASSQMFSHYGKQNPAANGDTFTTSFMLRAGTYTLSVVGITYKDKGKIDWYVDNVLQISGQDWYSSSSTYNAVKSDSITVVGDGYHVLKGVVNGKNASSTDYQMWLTEWWIAPASD